MRGVVYDAAFFRREIETLTLFLTQGISEEQREQFNKQLEAAKQHLAELERPVAPFEDLIEGNTDNPNFDLSDNGNRGS